MRRLANTFFAAVTLLAPCAEAEDIAKYWRTHFVLGGAIKVRSESTLGDDFSVTPASSYLVSRLRLSLAYQPTAWLRAYAETQDSRAIAYKTNPSTSVSNPLDLRQAWFELGSKESPAVLRAGRQDMTLGSGRMIASSDWSNVSKTYDTLRGTLRHKGSTLDLIAGSVVLADAKRFDRHKPGEQFYAAYAVIAHVLPGATIEPYFIAKTQVGAKSKDGKTGDAETWAPGLRVLGKLPAGFDYTAEAVHESGSYSSDSVRAWGTATGLGWTPKSLPFTPRFSTEYVFATGDSGRKDGAHETFDSMYGLTQPLNSYTGLFLWRNIRDLRAGVAFNPNPKLKLTVDFRDYWLATTQDGLYNSSGTRTAFVAGATHAHVGDGVEATATWNLSKTLTAVVGVANLFPGDYLKEAKKTTGFVFPFLYVNKRF